jgi:hypothetical protein
MERAANVFKLTHHARDPDVGRFCGVSFLINSETGLAVSHVAFDSLAAMEGSRGAGDGTAGGGSANVRLKIMEVSEFELALAHLDVPELV